MGGERDVLEYWMYGSESFGQEYIADRKSF